VVIVMLELRSTTIAIAVKPSFTGISSSRTLCRTDPTVCKSTRY
jgi:hypothetical protein